MLVPRHLGRLSEAVQADDAGSDGQFPRAAPWWYSLSRKPIVIIEPIRAAQVRPGVPKTDWNIRATGLYADGQPLGFAGSEVISCQTPSGTLEFAVPRPDIALVLHVLRR